MPRNEDFLYQLGGVLPAPEPTRFAVIREDGCEMHTSPSRSLAELRRFCYAPESAAVVCCQSREDALHCQA